MAGIDLKKTTHEMVKNGTWKFDGIFWQAFENGLVGFDGENFIFPDEWDKHERKEATNKLKFILGLDTDLDSFYNEIVDSRFAFLIDEFYGLTVPAAPSPYQALVEVVAQQQINFEFAQRTIRNLVKLAGKRIGDLYVFPSAEKITSLSEEELKKAKLGYRAGYIKFLTELYLNGELNLELWDWREEDSIKYLTKFRGIGKWSAELFLLYGLRKNVYPAGDLGLRRGVAKIFGKNVKEVKEKDVRELIEPYGKWKSLLAFYVLCYDRKTEMERKRK
ncbi:DNA-3-methyladenine glycosylase 2 family protein [Thermococcus sp. GR7]|uniref:DNA-3-methyladenine glycosylase family protein n=1 Tax=unclassified Thermococcus TaxID=2627626 RepID=UPI00143148C8|nr:MULTISPECIES: DNA-3-methyladenine glycosylase [unclassified Thermococcus]NJE47799.1 DNA-3-methyladenine glycosylase 2 family protein [Thermococcus sp. GR7]NJE79161.1 DNA-3-methyladenine glycosylase 2 family protein [Thermococcus sp. GR4]NJF23440.1 DNA-3-methyladenine glycosylase 2 family protein [Thermococcus sp. GR5]